MKEESALISLDDQTLLFGWGNPIWQPKPNENRPAFYFPDFFLKNETPWLSFDHYQIFSKKELQEEQVKTFPKKWTNKNREVYRSEFSKLKNLIHSGSLDKAVPFVFEEHPHPPDEKQIQATLQKLLTSSNPIHLYGYRVGSEGMIGGTPELLFHLAENRLYTEAVAGTVLLEDTLQNNPKILHEHKLVVDGICHSLQSFGKLTVGELEILKLSKIKHLKRSIQLELSHKVDWNRLLNALHPTPALGAFPKDVGACWLKEYPIPRGRYGAPVGAIFEKKFYCYVAIRNIQWDRYSSRIGAGGGVVATSDLDQEWGEIQWKLEAIKESLAL